MTEQDKQQIKQLIETAILTTKAAPNGVRWTPYSFNSNFTRVFPSNAVLFVNTAAVPTVAPFDTPAILINDNFRLIPGASLSLNGNSKEIDLTIYKCTFEPGATLAMWIKEDAGVTLPGSFKDYVNMVNVPVPSKRAQQQFPRKRLQGLKRTVADF